MKEFTAKDARALQADTNNEQLSLIVQTIKEEAIKMYSNRIIFWCYDISSVNQNILRDNGFKIEYQPESFDYVEHFTIAW